MSLSYRSLSYRSFSFSSLNYRVLAFSAALVATLATTAGAVTHFSAVMTGLQEVPPNVSPATGLGTLVLNDAEDQVTVHIDYSGLTSAPTNGHIHQAAAGVAGPVMIPFGAPFTSPIDQVLPITPAQVVALKAGNTYYNVHSQTFPGGEIRGQILTDPVPSAPSTWTKIKALYQ